MAGQRGRRERREGKGWHIAWGGCAPAAGVRALHVLLGRGGAGGCGRRDERTDQVASFGWPALSARFAFTCFGDDAPALAQAADHHVSNAPAKRRSSARARGLDPGGSREVLALLLSLLTDPGLLFTLLAEPSVLLRLVRQVATREAHRPAALPALEQVLLEPDPRTPFERR